MGQLQDAIHLAAHLGGIQVGNEAVHTGVARIIDTGGGAGDQEVGEPCGGMELGCQGAQPGGGAPDERGRRQQLAAVVLVAQPTPQRVKERANDEGAGVDQTPLGVGHVEGAHDVCLQRANQELVGLVQEHEDEENDHCGLGRPVHLRFVLM